MSDNGADTGSRQGDLLLWLAAGAVAALGAAWLVILQPWSGDDAPLETATAAPEPARPASPVDDAAGEPADDDGAEPRLASDIDNPLRTAQLALEAGMLLEPESSSAWALFSRVLENDPENETALAGRARVAQMLVERADTALEQGRVEDARAVGERILQAIEDHDGATALMARIEEATQPPAPEPEPAPETDAASAAAEPSAEPEPDPIEVAFEEAQAAFAEAMDTGRLLTPPGSSARDFVAEMVELDAEDERTLAARRTLFDELLARSTSALEARDTAAARTWIDEAERLDVDASAIENARTRVVDTLVAQESNRPLPLSSLELTEYVPPVYPEIAARRDVEGWVDVELTVTTDGRTRDVEIVDGSHDSLFRDATLTAIEQWRFEPRVFMDRRIDQRAYTRIRFNLD